MAKHYVKVGNRVKIGDKFFVARRCCGEEELACPHCAFYAGELKKVCEKDILACDAGERADKNNVYFEALK